MALILVFSFAFGLFRVLISPDDPSGRDMGLLLLCSAGMALAMLCIVMAFSVSLGWDSIVYLALPLIAAAALVLSVVDFGDRSFVWAIVVAAIRVADLIMWMIFASLARTARRRSPVPVFAFGKLLAQIGVLVGILVANVLARAFDVESLLLPTALAFLVLVTVFGSFAAIRGRMPMAQGGASDTELPAAPDAEASAAQARIRAIAQERGLSPRETEDLRAAGPRPHHPLHRRRAGAGQQHRDHPRPRPLPQAGRPQPPRAPGLRGDASVGGVGRRRGIARQTFHPSSLTWYYSLFSQVKQRICKWTKSLSCDAQLAFRPSFAPAATALPGPALRARGP